MHHLLNPPLYTYIGPMIAIVLYHYCKMSILEWAMCAMGDELYWAMGIQWVKIQSTITPVVANMGANVVPIPFGIWHILPIVVWKFEQLTWSLCQLRNNFWPNNLYSMCLETLGSLPLLVIPRVRKYLPKPKDTIAFSISFDRSN